MRVNNELFAANLRSKRAWRNLSLNDVQKQTGISVSTLSNIENGKGNCLLETALTLADFYETTLDELVGRVY